jgi:tRNA (mo5U34)-methyltransferase
VTLQSDARHDEELGALAPWFHNLHLPDGRQTAPDHPLGDYPSFVWERIAPHLPAQLAGKTALDVGCNAGFHAFELARRGAEVTGLDVDAHYLRQARWAARRFGLEGRVRFRQGQVYDLARDPREYDLVLFLGVLYHLRHPLLALDLLAARVRELLVLQTLTMPGEEAGEPPPDVPLAERERLRQPGWPALAFVEGELAGDPTNWWAPNPAAVEAMVRSTGLEVVARPGPELWICRRGPRYDELRRWHAAELHAATGGPARPG